MIYALPAPQVPADVEITIVSTDLNDRPSLPIGAVGENVTSNESPGQEWLMAQVVPANDGTNTTVDQVDNQYTIRGGQRSLNQENLFHSFEQFGLQPGEIADFLSDPQTRNMLVRVVGGDASLINGLLRVSGSNANFYLMNPAGVIFGNHASLDVPANFLTTTATGIGFGEGNWFSAIGENSYESLGGNPDALAFAIEQSGVIINSGNLAVAPGQSLALLGDLVINTGDLSAHNGQVILAAVSGENLVRISQEGQILSLEFSPLSSDDSRPNAWVSDISSLPALLTDESIHHATDVVLHEDGTVTLSGSSIEIDSTDRRLFALGYTDFHGSLDLILADINSW
ncbi:MAG: filamentous hemagglutinin N-terminal domain-containing protein, partial [Elainellaceae cyanobacterium]